jgi:predicted nucleic acid-binding protein
MTAGQTKRSTGSRFTAALSPLPSGPAASYAPRGLIDCMIATVAWRCRATLLTCDADLEHIASIAGIGLDQPTAS